MKTIKKIIGLSLIAMVFIFIFALCAFEHGFKTSLIGCGVALAITGAVSVGANLWMS